MQSHESAPGENADRTLVEAMLSGDESAFRSFFESYFPRVYRFALLRLDRDAEATKEVVQSTLTKAVRSLAGFRGEATLFSWLCQICRHQIVDHLRMQQRYAAYVQPIDDGVHPSEVLERIEAPVTDEPPYRYDTSERRRLVYSVLNSLPSRYASVLKWKYIDERSVTDIGQCLGIGRGAAQSILARARIAFRAALVTELGASATGILTDRHGN